MIKKATLKLFFLSILCASTASFAPAYSEEESTTEQPKAEQLVGVDYTSLESLGLLSVDDSRSMGNGLYRHTKRTELISYLKTIKHSPWIGLNQRVKDFLLTQADAGALKQDTSISPKNNLLILRLKALLNLGYNSEALALYTKASKQKLDEPMIRTGIYAMLLNKEKALACLETKTVFSQYKDMNFWKELDAYCSLSLSKVKNQEDLDIISASPKTILKIILHDESYILEYEPSVFKALSPLERAVLTAEDRIALPKKSAEEISSIPANHLALLLKQSNINEQSKTLLLTRAIEYGVKDSGAIKDLYEGLLEKNKDIKATDSDSNLLKLARLYDKTKGSWLLNAPKEEIENAFTLAQNQSDLLLLPFLPTIDKFEIEKDISIDNAIRSIKLHIYTNNSPSEDWVKDLLNIDEGVDNLKKEKALILLIIMANIDNKKLMNNAYSFIAASSPTSSKQKAIKNIIENIDITPNNSDKVPNIDVNDFDLVWNKGYTMPPYIVLNTLEQSSENQNISVSLLLSTRIMSEIRRQDTYIGTLGDIAVALSNVGLKETSRSILAQALMNMDD